MKNHGQPCRVSPCRRVSGGGGEDSSPESTSSPADERSSVHNATSTSATLSGLRPHTWYQLTVQAYNGRGFSPRAAGARARTLEDVPSAPPRQLSCSAAGASQLRLSWSPPPAAALNGQLVGYQLKTEAVDELDGK